MVRQFSASFLLHFGRVVALVGASACAAHAGPKAPETAAVPVNRHAFSADDMLAMDRIRELDVSPDGKSIAFTVSSTDLAGNKRTTDIWAAALDGSNVRRLTTHPSADGGPHFAPDGKSVLFVSSRSGSPQVW